jgi:hypothetical protein
VKFPKFVFFALLLLLQGCLCDMCFLKLSEFFEIWPQKLHLKGPFNSPCKFFMWTVRCCFSVKDFEHVTQKNFLFWGHISPETAKHMSLLLWKDLSFSPLPYCIKKDRLTASLSLCVCGAPLMSFEPVNGFL